MLEGNVCLLIAKTFLLRLFLRLNWKVGWTTWFSRFFIWCYFAANLDVCIAALLCHHIFSVLLRNLANMPSLPKICHTSYSADISIFSSEICNFCYIRKYRYILHFGKQFLVFKDFFNKHGYNFDNVSKTGYSRTS